MTTDLRKIINALATHGVAGTPAWNLVVQLAKDGRAPTRAEWASLGLRTSDEIEALLDQSPAPSPNK